MSLAPGARLILGRDSFTGEGRHADEYCPRGVTHWGMARMPDSAIYFVMLARGRCIQLWYARVCQGFKTQVEWQQQKRGRYAGR